MGARCGDVNRHFEVIAAEIAEDLRAALEQFEAMDVDLEARAKR